MQNMGPGEGGKMKILGGNGTRVLKQFILTSQNVWGEGGGQNQSWGGRGGALYAALIYVYKIYYTKDTSLLSL